MHDGKLEGNLKGSLGRNLKGNLEGNLEGDLEGNPKRDLKGHLRGHLNEIWRVYNIFSLVLEKKLVFKIFQSKGALGAFSGYKVESKKLLRVPG